MELPVYNDIHNYNKFFSEVNNRKNWKVFYNYFNIPIKYKILDFGCGAGWGVRIGLENGYDIQGIDTRYVGVFDKLQEFRKALEVDSQVKIYNGIGKLPFDDDSFDVIVCRASFNKFKNIERNKDINKLVMERLREFSRILTEKRILVITGKYFKKEINKFDLRVFNWNKYSVNRIWRHCGL